MDEKLEQAAATIEERFGAQREVFRDQLRLILSPEKLVEAARTLRDAHGFIFLSDESAVDYGPQADPRFHMIYQLRTMQAPFLHIMLRVPLHGNAPRMETLEKVFPNANWFEREVWDLLGIYFDGHSDMRRIIMPYDWEGHPLRKDYPLGYEEVQFSFNVEEINVRKSRPKE